MFRLTLRLARAGNLIQNNIKSAAAVNLACHRCSSTDERVEVIKKVTDLSGVKIRGGHLRRPIEMENDELVQKFDSAEDHWELRGLINDLAGEDMVAAPEVVIAGLYACRRMNDHATAVRFLESVRDKCIPNEKVLWPWMLEQIRPTLDTLGVSTPEEMGYGKPELYLQDVDDM